MLREPVTRGLTYEASMTVQHKLLPTLIFAGFHTYMVQISESTWPPDWDVCLNGRTYQYVRGYMAQVPDRCRVSDPTHMAWVSLYTTQYLAEFLSVSQLPRAERPNPDSSWFVTNNGAGSRLGGPITSANREVSGGSRSCYGLPSMASRPIEYHRTIPMASFDFGVVMAWVRCRVADIRRPQTRKHTWRHLAAIHRL